MEEVTVGGVELDELETGCQRASRGGFELFDDELGVFDFGGGGVFGGEGEGGYAQGDPGGRGGGCGGRVPGSAGAGLPAGVCELDGGDCAMVSDECGDGGEGFDVVVGPDAEVAG